MTLQGRGYAGFYVNLMKAKPRIRFPIYSNALLESHYLYPRSLLTLSDATIPQSISLSCEYLYCKVIITVRGQSYVSPPLIVAGGGHTRRAERGVGRRET
jgi:hypothetical protein